MPKLYTSQQEANILKQQVSKASYQQAQQAMPKAVLFKPRVKE